jgi:hypothetical protein
VPCFDIDQRPGQTLKSASATRRVTLHWALIQLGLLELVDLRRRQGEVRLFPIVTRGRNGEALNG